MSLERQKTLAEAMALAVLRGDMLDAYALADLLQEERDGGFEKIQQSAREIRETARTSMHQRVYGWPEFKALCKRLGVLWDLRTVEITIHLPAEGLPTVEQTYRGVDTSPGG